jgi:hypothetical protein
MTARSWNTTVRPWVVAAKTLLPHRSINFGAAPSRRTPVVAVVALGLATAAVAGTGTAYAYLTTQGSGSNSSLAASAYPSSDNLTTAATTTTTLLRPGGTGDVAVKITNPNSFAVKVTAVNLTPAAATGCSTPSLSSLTPSGYTVAGSAVSLPLSVGAGSTVTVTVVGAVQMGASSNDCQNVTLTVPATLNWNG